MEKNIQQTVMLSKSWADLRYRPKAGYFVDFDEYSRCVTNLVEPFLRISHHYVSTQEISSILWNPKVHYRVQKSSPLLPLLS
jgi:hypothetical protein